MYSVCANINDVSIATVALLQSFHLDTPKIIETLTSDPLITVIFLCSPGNPTGTLLKRADIIKILESSYAGLVVVDEAYVDFCNDDASCAKMVLEYPNLIVIQTLSKSFGMAGIRFGASISTPEITRILNATKAPYNISTPTSSAAFGALSVQGLSKMRENVQILRKLRATLLKSLCSIPRVGEILGTNDANFVLFRVLDVDGKACNVVAKKVYKKMAEGMGVVVRYRGDELWCEGCLRVSVGSENECVWFLECLRECLKGGTEEES